MQQGLRYGDPLFLSAGEVHAAFADSRIVSFFKGYDKVVDASLFGRGHNLVESGKRISVPYVLSDRAVEHLYVLGDA